MTTKRVITKKTVEKVAFMLHRLQWTHESELNEAERRKAQAHWDRYAEFMREGYRREARLLLKTAVPGLLDEAEVREQDAATVEALCPDPHTVHAGDYCPYWHAAAVLRGESQ